MSGAIRETAKTVATLWVNGGSDEWGEKDYAAPVTILTTFDRGSDSKTTDSTGVDFLPLAVIHFEYNGIDVKEGDYIAAGDYTSFLSPTEVEDSLPIRKVMRHDNSAIDEIDDVEVTT